MVLNIGCVRFLCAPRFPTQSTSSTVAAVNRPLAKQLLESTMGSSGGSDRTWPIWCVMTHIAIETGLVEIVSFPINNMVDLSSSLCENLPEGIPLIFGLQLITVITPLASCQGRKKVRTPPPPRSPAALAASVESSTKAQRPKKATASFNGNHGYSKLAIECLFK